ncbi:MAG: hypothetical protein GY928_02350, partial [Colwellia sp.]|nr:hypothetical protein [Colwellia sp.]
MRGRGGLAAEELEGDPPKGGDREPHLVVGLCEKGVVVTAKAAFDDRPLDGLEGGDAEPSKGVDGERNEVDSARTASVQGVGFFVGLGVADGPIFVGVGGSAPLDDMGDHPVHGRVTAVEPVADVGVGGAMSGEGVDVDLHVAREAPRVEEVAPRAV